MQTAKLGRAADEARAEAEEEAREKEMTMNQITRLSLTELTRFALECTCGTEIEMETGGSYPAPQQCPACGAVFDQATVGPVLAAIRDAYRKLTRLAEAGSSPRVTFRIRPKE
jgi:hypothetical protein